MYRPEKILLFWLLLLSSSAIWAQLKDVNGIVIAEGDVESIHVINITSKRFTTTNLKGEFLIPASVGDRIELTSVRYKTQIVELTQAMYDAGFFRVILEDEINELNEVVVGKVLTGDLGSDIKNSDAKRDINFYDLGLPGYTGKPLTQSERRLAEADAGKFVYVGLGVGVNLHKLLNTISGRTKMLKERVRLERNTELMNSIRDRLSRDFFGSYPLEEKHHEEFFFFVSEDENFEHRCRNRADIYVIEYLKEKYEAYLENLKTKKD